MRCCGRWLCVCVGLVGIVCLPLLANKTYISENAISVSMPQIDTSIIQDINEDYAALRRYGPARRVPALWEYIESADRFISNHTFSSTSFSFSSALSNLNNHNRKTLSGGTNRVSVVYSERGTGMEAMVLSVAVHVHNVRTVTILANVMKYLRRVNWLARDIYIVWIDDTQDRNMAYRGLESWIDSTSAPPIVRMAFHLDFKDDDPSSSSSFFSSSSSSSSSSSATPPQCIRCAVGWEGHGGLLANMDILTTARRVASDMLHCPSMWHRTERNAIGRMLPLLWQNMLALGSVPSLHVHASWLKRSVDALTLSTSSSECGGDLLPPHTHGTMGANSGKETQATHMMLSWLLMMVQASNNLIEELHHSYFYYMPLSQSAFISIGHYFMAIGPLLAAAVLPLLGQRTILFSSVMQSLLQVGCCVVMPVCLSLLWSSLWQVVLSHYGLWMVMAIFGASHLSLCGVVVPWCAKQLSWREDTLPLAALLLAVSLYGLAMSNFAFVVVWSALWIPTWRLCLEEQQQEQMKKKKRGYWVMRCGQILLPSYSIIGTVLVVGEARMRIAAALAAGFSLWEIPLFSWGLHSMVVLAWLLFWRQQGHDSRKKPQ
jgi:hypothetical protein